jgi:glucose-6-phosphate-specific signal transduction histidine kinase
VLHRVTQETLNNVGKHAGASRVTVPLAAENGSVRLRINDDGVGFDPLAAGRLLSEGHSGLAGMRARVEMAGATSPSTPHRATAPPFQGACGARSPGPCGQPGDPPLPLG